MELQVFVDALTQLFEPTHLAFLLFGTGLGLLVGVAFRRLGGVAGLSLLLPFVYDMEPSHALAMMIGLLAPTTTSDTFPSVLMGIPGTSASQATVVDGFPLAKKGEGARALGAAFSASLFGGLFGAVVLTGAIFAARPIILAMGIRRTDDADHARAQHDRHAHREPRLQGAGDLRDRAGHRHGRVRTAWRLPAVGDSRRLRVGLSERRHQDRRIIGLGMFAMPEIVDLVRRHETISKDGMLGSGWVQGFKDMVKHWWIVIRCATIGCIVGVPARAGRIGRRLDRLRPCGSDIQGQVEIRYRRYPGRPGAGNRRTTPRKAGR